MLLLLLLSHFRRVRLCVTPYMAAHQAPLSLGFSRQLDFIVPIKPTTTTGGGREEEKKKKKKSKRIYR